MRDDATPAKVRLTDGLGPLLDGEEDPARLWAEIHLLRAAVQGPDGYATWQDAAIAERVRRVKAEIDRLCEAGQRLVDAYRDRYRKPSTDGLRANAPLRHQFAEFNATIELSRRRSA